MHTTISFRINGSSATVDADVRETLLDVIRERLGLTGTKRGCDEGACGACTVLLDGRPVASCSILAVEAEGREIITIEGLSPDGRHPVQQAFIDSGAVQCGFCTPGMVLSSTALLEKNPHPTPGEVKEALSGNLCRCTGYRKIVDAVLLAASRMGGNRG